MPPNDGPVGQAQSAGGAHIVELAVAQKLGAHVVGQAHPAKQAQQNQQQADAGLKHRRKDDEQVELGHGTPNLDEALHGQIDLAHKETLNGARHHTQDGAGDGERQREQHRDPKTIEQTRQQIAAPVVGAQPVVGRRRRGVGLFGKVIQGAVVVRVQGVNGPVARLLKLLANEGVEEVGGGGKVAAKRGLRWVLEHRHMQLPLVAGQQRFVVRHQLGRQTHHEQQHKQHQADKAQPVAFETLPSQGGRRQRDGGHGAQSNFTRGSTHT